MVLHESHTIVLNIQLIWDLERSYNTIKVGSRYYFDYFLINIVILFQPCLTLLLLVAKLDFLFEKRKNVGNPGMLVLI